MSKRALGLTWLDSNDHKQLKWAHKYLQAKGEIDQQHRSSTIDQLLRIGERLEDSKDGILIIGQMGGAWRQVKCRDSDRDKDRKTSAFKLKIDVKKELAWLAKKNKITAADMLSRLISAELDAHERFEEKLNEAKKTHKELLSDSRNNTAHYRQANGILRELLEVSVAQLCRSEVLLKDASISTESLTEDQQRRIEQLRKQTMAEVGADIKGEIKLLRSGLLDRPIKGSNATRHASKEIAAETGSSTTTQPARPQVIIDENPVAHPAPRDQQTPEAKPEPSNALVSNSANPVADRPIGEDLEAQANESASAHLKSDGPSPNTQAATQSPLGGGISLKALGISFANKKRPITSTVKTEPD